MALKADSWLTRIIQICASNDLPHPLDDEKLPVGTGSNPVSGFSSFAFLYVLLKDSVEISDFCVIFKCSLLKNWRLHH